MKPKIVLVTGGARGLGFEFCRQLGLRGCSVIMTSRNAQSGEAAADRLRGEGISIRHFTLDVSQEPEIAELVNSFPAEIDHLDLLINNAGINSKSTGDEADFLKSFKLSELDPESVLHMMQVNAIAPILMVKHFLPLLRKSRNPKVVNISSWLGSISEKQNGGNYSYCSSKAALNMLTRTLAFDVMREGVTAIMVNPGWVKTDMGGSRAKLTPEKSVEGLLEVIDKVTIRDTGKFYQWDGSEHPF